MPKQYFAKIHLHRFQFICFAQISVLDLTHLLSFFALSSQSSLEQGWKKMIDNKSPTLLINICFNIDENIGTNIDSDIDANIGTNMDSDID